MKSNKRGYVYVFANPSFPDWVKVGKTKDWNKRIKNGNTYTPFDFYPVAILETSDMDAVELKIHKMLKIYEQFKKEFFCVKTRVHRVLDLLFLEAQSRGELEGLTVFRRYRENDDVVPDYTYDANGRQIKIKANPKLYKTLFHAARSDTNIKMRVDFNNRFVVLKGSRLEQMTDALRTATHQARVSIRNERKRLENNRNKVRDTARGKILICDEAFKSSSRALAVMLGCSAMQGPEYWIDNDGKRLSDYLSADGI